MKIKYWAAHTKRADYMKENREIEAESWCAPWPMLQSEQ